MCVDAKLDSVAQEDSALVALLPECKASRPLSMSFGCMWESRCCKNVLMI